MKKFIFAIALALTSLVAHALEIPWHTQVTRYYMFGDQAHEKNGLTDVQTDVKILNEPDTTTKWGYYAQFFWAFQGNHTGKGYTGLRRENETRESKNAVFAIWDDSTGQAVKVISPHCFRSPTNGWHSRCVVEYPWVANRTYTLRVQKEAGGVDGARWGAYVFDTVTNAKTLIGVLEVPADKTDPKNLGNIWPHSLAHANEFYYEGAGKSCADVPYFGIEWNGPFGNNQTRTASNTQVDYTDGVGAAANKCTNIKTQNIGPFAIRQEVGPGISHTNAHGSDVGNWEAKKLLDPVDCVFNWVEKSFPAATNGTEEVRRSSYLVGGEYVRDYRVKGVGYKLGITTIDKNLFISYSDGQRSVLGDVTQFYQATNCIDPQKIVLQ